MRIVALTLAAFLPAFVALLASQWQMGRFRQQEVEGDALRAALQASNDLASIINGVETMLVAIAAVDDVRSFRVAECTAYLQGLQARSPHLTAITAIDLEGNPRCRSIVPTAQDSNYRNRPYFNQALKENHAVVGTYVVGNTTRRPTLPIALAIRDEGGRPTGILAVGLDLEWLGRRIRERGLPDGDSISIADRNGQLLAREPLSQNFVGTQIPEDFMHLVKADKPGVQRIVSRDGTPRVLGYVPIGTPPENIYVSVGLSEENSFGPARRTIWTSVLISALGGIATLVFAWTLGKRMLLDPLRRINVTLAQWRQGHLAARTGGKAETGELGALGATLDDMIQQVQSAQAQKDLVRQELAHRIKNLLAGVQALATLSLNSEKSGKALLPGYLARLASLAEAQTALANENFEALPIDELVSRALGPLGPEVSQRIAAQGERVDLPAEAASGLGMVLHELATNALKYGALSHDDGRVQLDWRLQDTEGGRHVEVEWKERNGPAPVASDNPRKGFGTRLIQQAMGSNGEAHLTLEPDGARCRILVHLT